jgi:DNA-binding YbaB/EbfC family protein
MQQMIMQAQKMQRELKKAKDELAKQEFTVTKGGAVTVKMMGDKTIESISIDEDAFDKENKEMVEDLLALALNELYAQVEEAESKIEQKITGKAGGFGF